MTEKDSFDFNVDWDITEQISRLDNGTEITLVFDNSSEYTHISLYRENPKTHAKTMFVSYTPAKSFSGHIELFKFKIDKHLDGKKIEIKKKCKTIIKKGIEVNISFNPSIKWHWQRETESE